MGFLAYYIGIVAVLGVVFYDIIDVIARLIANLPNILLLFFNLDPMIYIFSFLFIFGMLLLGDWGWLLNNTCYGVMIPFSI